MNARGPWAVQLQSGAERLAATARLLDDALLLEHALGVTMVELATLEGVTLAGSLVSLHPHGEPPLVLDAPESAELVRAVSNAATTIPELAASLRAMGSPRARPGSDHDLWFGALLAARRVAHAAPTPAERLAAFDTQALLAALDATITQFATARAPTSAADARALAEELRELSTPLLLALRSLASRRSAVESADDAVRLARWHDWVAALRVVFAAADRVWEALLPALVDPRGRRGSFWRRVLARKGGA